MSARFWAFVEEKKITVVAVVYDLPAGTLASLLLEVFDVSQILRPTNQRIGISAFSRHNKTSHQSVAQK
jgi:hypothetical protein